jgi:hypothetical protein
VGEKHSRRVLLVELYKHSTWGGERPEGGEGLFLAVGLTAMETNITE